MAYRSCTWMFHEMGGVRMGTDPKTSMLNKWNQMHAVKNVFVTDGACMTSTSTQNPSLTYMALTARAVDYAVKEMRKGSPEPSLGAVPMLMISCAMFVFQCSIYQNFVGR